MFTDPAEDYARGWVPFLDCKIFLDSRPLIPRVETEFWTEKAIDMLHHNSPIYGTVQVLDLFAGSGAIGVAVLKHVPDARVDFGELEARHLPTIEKNIAKNRIDTNRTNIIKTDVYSDIVKRYDFILANPPYLAVLNPGLAQEPTEALLAPDGGFALIEKTVKGAQEHLTPGGSLWLEHDPEQAEKIGELAHAEGFALTTYPDQYGLPRYSVMA